jgi:hypothetical protein
LRFFEVLRFSPDLPRRKVEFFLVFLYQGRNLSEKGDVSWKRKGGMVEVVSV